MTNHAWQEAVDLPRLAAWMDTHQLGSGPIADPVPLAGGTQNILLRLRRGEQGFVLRRPSLHAGPEIRATIGREARVLAALRGTPVPHPALFASCLDESVLGTPFYLMAPVEGFNASGTPLPAMHAADAEVQRRMGFSMVDALLRLGEVDPQAAGLADFGKPQGFLERQVARWRAQLAQYGAHAGWPGPDALPGVEAVAQWLEANRPTPSRTGILHGDFHLANVMFRNDGAEVAAVIDWELATVGDPLLDLGWLVATWPDANGRGAGSIRVSPWHGFPAASELVAYYRERSDRDLGAIDWYVVLARFKLGILLEGSYARSCAGKASVEQGEQHHASALRLLLQASEQIAELA
ncbi:aminoglycoside phosphotransferase [Cupriavidus sp. SHE]|uniref:Phosphotransferase family protein n=1 Tax=Cupriavidus metallidurans TaxID=119219 RepID=A0A482IW59_9BURK|nr:MULTISPECIES: phosphotransferase family protein [Cupriavidus]KWR76308.1 aminoglycoside phosphotransferase [Cupriavidus sp. SHE]QBP11803.1 phosphotransferase family protein [Cupriavidus metallidurans]